MEASLTALAENLQARDRMLNRLEALVNASPVAMFTCKAGGDFGTTFVTEGVRALWGYEPEDFLTKPGFWGEHIHPEDAPTVFAELARLAESGTRGYDYRFRTKTGEYRWTHDELRLVRDAAGNPLEIAGYCFDITDRKLSEAALRETEALQKIIFNSTSDLQALFRVQPDRGFVTESINRAMAENLQARMGQQAERFLEKDFSELLAATGLDAGEIENRRQLYRRVTAEKTLVRFDTPASDLRDPLEVTVFPVIDQGGNCTHVLWNGRNIARRIRAEAARRESEERYKLVTDAIHEGIFDWNVVTGEYYLSPRYKEILGFGEEDLAGTPESFFGRLHPDDSARMADTVDRYNRDLSRDRFSDQVRLRHRDGSYRWVASRGRIVRGHDGVPARIIGAIGDITERLESAANLAASEQRLRDIIESLFGFVGVFTLDGQLIDCNHGTLDDSGIGPEDVIGHVFWETPGWRHDPVQQDLMRKMMARAAAGEVVRFETKPLIRGQQEIVVDMTLGPLRDRQGNVCNIVAHGMDITPRKQAEADLLKAKEAAESASCAKSEFLANMSHEIRTPMNGIIGLTEVLLDTRLDPEQREYLTLVQHSAASLLTIINDILDVSKIEAGKLQLEIQDFDLREVVLDTLRGLKVPAESKGLHLGSAVDSQAPAVVRGDPGRLRQILINLAGNAIKFTESGEVTVHVQPWSELPGFLHFAVRDTGIGIAAGKQALIFEAFTQADGSYTRKFGGTGLGLTIASRLVQMMEGRIWVESREGEGSTFHFTARLEPARAV